jgi:ABC-2 type transport system permease protein
MTATLAHSWFMTRRHVMALLRQPAWIFISLVQPIIWLLLYGALFKKIVEIPGFAAGSYIDFLTPGIVVMTAFFSAGWSGMSLIDDISGGVIDRFLVTPVRRGSLIWGRLLQFSLVAIIQSVIVLVLALAVGAHYPGGLPGILVLILAAVLLGSGIGGLSNAIACLSRRQETMVAASNLVLLPLTFLSSVFMAPQLMPGWMQAIARYNPVDWAVWAGRDALSTDPDWGAIGIRLGALAALVIVAAWLATRAFRAYQRSI